MGGSSSKSKSEIFVENVNSAFVNSIQSCSGNNTVEQTIHIKGNNNFLDDVSMDMVFTGLMTCVQDVNMVAKIQNDLYDAIKSSADAQGVAVLGALGNTDSDVETGIRKSINNAINVTTLTKLVNDIKASQMIMIEGSGNVFLNVSQRQVTSNIASSSQQVVANIDVLNQIKHIIEQTSKSVQSDPISNFLNGLAKLISGPVMWFAIILLGGLIIIVIFLNTGAGASVLEMAQTQQEVYNESKANESS